ncbi:MAG: formate dehydrogenase subunit alpha [Flexistipes sinusarabici]|uniref:Formate dehydrogenase subunit alpha n=1 Tax=Flexistipes sinusarabici TaxID=2352 RepID=A0A5D0MPB0_FLESI|nr:formate dehydrogenase subunit alpha [Flexistipes sinusarabici]TYB33350.1 MAG: formate dehydrogenase subunit alpha [Flexistipes sinusarabici]
MVNIRINGKETAVKRGKTILRVLQDIGIRVPTLCFHKYLSPIGRCKVCIVKADNRFVTACDTPVKDSMEIVTDSPDVEKLSKINIELMLSNIDSSKVPKKAEINDLLYSFRQNAPKNTEIKENPFFKYDASLCVLCGRCVTACSEIQGRFIWNYASKGSNLHLTVGMDETFEDAHCEFCGTCVDFCPTGAIADKNTLSSVINKVTTVCSYCGVGCKVKLTTDGKKIVSGPSDEGDKYTSLCVKGRYAHSYILSEERLKKPLVRKYLLTGKEKNPGDEELNTFAETGWDNVMDIVCDKLIQIEKSFGSDALGFLASAKCTNEENYLMQKLARQIFKTNNVDHCARLCHSSTVAGLIQALGSGAMTNTMEDILEYASTIFIIGSNVTEQHPVFGVGIRQAVMNKGINLVVADPRFTDIAEFSDIYLGINGGSDIALLNGLCRIILENGWEDKEFIKNRCENFDQFREHALSVDMNDVIEKTGLKYDELYKTAEKIACSKPTAVIWAMGITQHICGVDNVLALANLQMLTGNLGIKGGGLNPLRGQNNVQGACDMGALPNVFNGYQNVNDPEKLHFFQEEWGFADDKPLNTTTGLTVTEMIERGETGEIKSLYIMGENPVMTDPDVNKVIECLKKTEFVVLQDIFPSETSKYADVILPAASFAEKEGTFTNTERKIQKLTPLFPPLHESKTDLEILIRLAKKLIEKKGYLKSGEFSGWEYKSAKDVMDEINKMTHIYAGVLNDRLEKGEEFFWPVKDKNDAGTPVLHEKTFTRGKGKFHLVNYVHPNELPDNEYPFLLNTGREIFHWHGGELTRRIKEIMSAAGEAVVLINSNDAADMGIEDNAEVEVSSRRGVISAKAFLTDRVNKKTIFGNFHFIEDNVNKLTIKALDPAAKIPEYKVCAVKICPLNR